MFLLGDLRTSAEGFRKIIRLNDDLQACAERVFEIDFSGTCWIDANMCSPLGAVIWKSCRSDQKCDCVHFMNLGEKQKEILLKNGFLSENCGLEKQPDIHGTTIVYKHIWGSSFGASSTDTEFKDYIQEHFREDNVLLPEIEPSLLSRFRESLYEVFHNACEHARSHSGIFACGQHFPQKNLLRFTITDLGIGFDGSVRENLGIRMTAVRSIQWALKGNTTRSLATGRPGGLGLQMMRDFLESNKGCMSIVSNEGYWNSKSASQMLSFESAFPGSIVTIEIDTKSRHLRDFDAVFDVIDDQDIF